MSQDFKRADPALEWLMLALGGVILGSVFGIGISVTKMLKPAGPQQAVTEPAVEQPVITKRVLDRAQKQAWRPQSATSHQQVQARLREKKETQATPRPPNVEGVLANSKEFHKKQLAALRQDSASDLDDEPSAIPQEADILAMEKNGVMVW